MNGKIIMNGKLSMMNEKENSQYITHNSPLKKGYKQTEVGVIPKNWEVEPLNEAVDFLDGQRRPIKSSERAKNNGTYPYYGASGIIDYVDDYIFDDNLILLGEDGENILSRNLPLAFQVSGKIWVNNHAHVLKPKENYHITFLTNYLESLDYSLLNSGTAQPKLNKKTCQNILISCPTKAEQTAIATALSDMDSLIEGLEKLLVKKRNIKQGAMQELLKPKEGWVEKSLGKMLVYEQPTKYLVENTEYNPNSGIPVLTAGKSFILGYTNEIFGVFENIPVIIFDDFTTSSQFVDFRFKVKSSALKILKQRLAEYNIVFLYSLIQLIKFDATDHKRYWISEYQNIQVKVPNIDEQNHIAKILSDMDTEIEQLEIQLSKYKMLKTGMMQELLTGKKRLI